MTQCLCGNDKIFPTLASQATPHLAGCPADPKFDVTKAALECAGRSISLHVRQLAGAWPDEAGKTAQAWIMIVELLGFRQGPPDSDGIPMPVSRFDPVKRWREVGGKFLCVDASTGKLVIHDGQPLEVSDAGTLRDIVAELVRARDAAPMTASGAGVTAPAPMLRETVILDVPATPAETTEYTQLRAMMSSATHLIAWDEMGPLHREPVNGREVDGVPSAQTYRFQLKREATGIQCGFVNAIGIPIWWTQWQGSDRMVGQPETWVAFKYNGVVPGAQLQPPHA